MMNGLTARRYSDVVKELEQVFGIEQSTISTHFIEASRQRLNKLLERPLGEYALCGMMIDGTCFEDQEVIVCLGITVLSWMAPKVSMLRSARLPAKPPSCTYGRKCMPPTPCAILSTTPNACSTDCCAS